MSRLSAKRCLIVGGTGGIGLATAQRFVTEGATLVIAGLDDAFAAIAAVDLPATVPFFACDAADAGQVDQLFAKTVAALGGLDVLVHVAGGSGRKFGDGSLHECTDAGWVETLRLNLDSVFLSNRAAVRQFLKQGQGGVILNLGSVLATEPSPRYFDTCAYTAAKAGIIGLSKQAAARYARDGIRVNVLAPGLIDTPMAGRAVGDPAIRAFLDAKQPLAPGPGRAEDVAEAAVFLCSQEARLITGAVLPVDGGWSVGRDSFTGSQK